MGPLSRSFSLQSRLIHWPMSGVVVLLSFYFIGPVLAYYDAAHYDAGRSYDIKQ